MIVLNILIGLIGLGLVVFVHELGHLIAAKLVGIDVETFSLGWGKKLAGFQWRGTEYRISVFPVGGFCKMKGERSYAQALDDNLSEIPREPGSFFAARPWRRIVALLAGPIANIVFAVFILSIVWFVGFETESYQNRIIITSGSADSPAVVEPARMGDLQTGDVVVAIGDREIETWSDLSGMIAQNALTTLPVTVMRDGIARSLEIEPALDPESGAGFIPIYPWVDPVIERVSPESPAAAGGVQPGDRITAVNGREVVNSLEVRSALTDASFPISVDVVRGGQSLQLTLPSTESGSQTEGVILGVAFQTLTVKSPDLNIFQAIGRGVSESVRILAVSVRGLRLLFRGVQITSAVAGPVRISYFIGDVATSGFALGFGAGVLALSNFLALLSVILFFMNLLPIPILDGGQIILATVEWVRGRSPRPKAVYRYQLVGSVVIVGILFVALFGDILFLAGR